MTEQDLDKLRCSELQRKLAALEEELRPSSSPQVVLDLHAKVVDIQELAKQVERAAFKRLLEFMHWTIVSDTVMEAGLGRYPGYGSFDPEFKLFLDKFVAFANSFGVEFR